MWTLLEGRNAHPKLEPHATRLPLLWPYNRCRRRYHKCRAFFAVLVLQGYDQVVEMQRILTAQKARTRLLVASVRDTNAMACLAAQVRQYTHPSTHVQHRLVCARSCWWPACGTPGVGTLAQRQTATERSCMAALRQDQVPVGNRMA